VVEEEPLSNVPAEAEGRTRRDALFCSAGLWALASGVFLNRENSRNAAATQAREAPILLRSKRTSPSL
jgi:hypothetical protein